MEAASSSETLVDLRRTTRSYRTPIRLKVIEDRVLRRIFGLKEHDII
jgi:hypothetical protein